MFSYRFPIALVTTVTTSLLIQPSIAIAQNLAEINNIAKNISVKITGYGNGSGFILDKQDNVYSVVTNKHVVPIDTEYQIQTHDGVKHLATERQEIPDLDLAIIRFESTEEYQVAELGDSDELNLQQTVSVAGFPREQTDLDLVRGDIRSIRQEIIANPASKQGYALIYTNQTLPGSSGGAVLDAKGRVVAINGEGETDIQTGREISRGIPINVFLDAEEKLLTAPEDNSTTTTSRTSNMGNSTLSSGEIENNTFGDYELVHTISNNARILNVAINENKIISIDSNYKIKVWNLITGKLERTFNNRSTGNDWITTISKDKIVSRYVDGTTQVRNLTVEELERTLEDSSIYPLYKVAVSGNKIIDANFDNKIEIWNLLTGKQEQTFVDDYDSKINSVAASGNKIVSASTDKTIKIWNLITGELEHTLTGHSGGVYSVVVSEDKIISGGWDKTIKIWNLTTGELEHTLTGHSDFIFGLAASKNKIVSGSSDKTIKIWRLKNRLRL